MEDILTTALAYIIVMALYIGMFVIVAILPIPYISQDILRAMAVFFMLQYTNEILVEQTRSLWRKS